MGAEGTPREGPPFDPEAEIEELKEYLGDDYDPDRLRRHRYEVEEELERLGDETELYRTSAAYLYDLTVFAYSGTKLPYLRALMRHVPPGARLLDYGCGIGSDGLALTAAGYEVAFADFDNPSVRYLRWRLERRGIDAEVYDIERDELPRDFAAAYAFDVIEHVDDPFAFLGRMEACAERVMVNLLEPEPDETVLHRDLPIGDLLRHAARRRLLHYRRYHGRRSHVVLYGSGRARGVARVVSAGRLAAGRLRGDAA